MPTVVFEIFVRRSLDNLPYRLDDEVKVRQGFARVRVRNRRRVDHHQVSPCNSLSLGSDTRGAVPFFEGITGRVVKELVR